MGTKMEPSYANLLVGFIVHQFFSQINGPQTWTLRSLNWRLYRRYLLYQRGANSNYNSCQLPSPKIYLGNFRHLFDFSRYQSFNWRKRPILQTYGLYRLTSSLVVFIFTSILHQEFCSFSRFLRLRCLCSDGSDFSDSSEAMYQFLINVAILFLLLKWATNTPNKLIDTQHYKRHRRKMPHSYTVKFVILKIVLNYFNMIQRLAWSFRNFYLFHSNVKKTTFWSEVHYKLMTNL